MLHRHKIIGKLKIPMKRDARFQYNISNSHTQYSNILCISQIQYDQIIMSNAVSVCFWICPFVNFKLGFIVLLYLLSVTTSMAWIEYYSIFPFGSTSLQQPYIPFIYSTALCMCVQYIAQTVPWVEVGTPQYFEIEIRGSVAQCAYFSALIWYGLVLFRFRI